MACGFTGAHDEWPSQLRAPRSVAGLSPRPAHGIPFFQSQRHLTTLRKVIGDKHEDVMAEFGAILAQGIIDAVGRNVTISLGAQPLSLTGICTHRNYRPQFRSEGTLCFISSKFSPFIYIVMICFVFFLLRCLKWSIARMPSLRSCAAAFTWGEKEGRKRTRPVLSITAKAKRREAAPLQEHSIGQYSCHDCCSEKEEERARLG